MTNRYTYVCVPVYINTVAPVASRAAVKKPMQRQTRVVEAPGYRPFALAWQPEVRTFMIAYVLVLLGQLPTLIKPGLIFAIRQDELM